MRPFVRRLVWLSVLLCACNASPPAVPVAPPRTAPAPIRSFEAAAPARANILVLLLDDVGFEMLGAFRTPGGADRPATPNIDALAARGVRFTMCIANPLCSPTRATIMTGRYGFRTGVGNIVGRSGKMHALPLDEVTLPEMLGPAGYDASLVGKWHLGFGDHALRSGWPWAAGTDANIVNIAEGRGAAVGRPGQGSESYWNWTKVTNGVAARCETYATSDTTNDALARIAAMRPPWLLLVSYNAVHGPWHTPPAELHGYRESLDTPRDRTGAMVEALDSEIGRLLAGIDQETLARTHILLASDNGPQAWTRDGQIAVEGARGKGALNVEGTRVPLLVAGPAVPAAQHGARSDALLNTVDLYATIADFAGATLPADRTVDGRSLRPLLSDPATSVREFAFAERFREAAADGRPHGHRWLLTDGHWWLYHAPDISAQLRRDDVVCSTDDPDARAALTRLRAASNELLGGGSDTPP